MAIGTTAAILGGAALIGGIGGSIIGADAQKDAAQQANQSQQAAVAAQLQLGQQSLALQQQLAAQSMGLSTDIYNTNYDLLSPWVARGNVAGDAYSALLGLPAAPTMASPMARPGGGTYTENGGMPLGGGTAANPGGTPIPGISAPPYSQAQIDAMWHDGVDGNAEQAQAANNAWYAAHPQGAASAPAPAPAPAATTMAAPTPAATATLLASPAPAPTAAPAPAPTSAPPTAAPTTGAGTYGAGTHAAGGPDGLTNDLALSGYGPGTMQSTNAGSHPASINPANPGGGMSPVGGTVGGIISGMPGVSVPTAPPPATTPPPASTPGGTTAPPPASGTAADPYDAFQNFANSAGMQFQLEQGTDAINNLYAGAGALQSGAAMKAINDYAQNTALNNYFMPYMNMLGGVSNTGAQAGSAVAGVGSQFSNTAAGINSGFGNAATGINGAMGGAIQSGANSASNAAIANGAATAGMWGNIGSSIGNAAGMLMPYPGY